MDEGCLLAIAELIRSALSPDDVAPTPSRERGTLPRSTQIIILVVALVAVAGILYLTYASIKNSEREAEERAQRFENYMTSEAEASIVDCPRVEGVPEAEEAGTGTLEDPYAFQTIQPVRGGRLAVNALCPDMTARVKARNKGFEHGLKAGEDWLLANVTYYCDLPEGESCALRDVAIRVANVHGAEYIKEGVVIVVIDKELASRVDGGDHAAGNLPFAVPGENTDFLLVAETDAGETVYFETEARE